MQRRKRGAQGLCLIDHELRRTAIGGGIRQPPCGDHAVGNGLLLPEHFFTFLVLFWLAERGDMADASGGGIRFFQL